MKEVWQDVKGYEGLYQVSNLGRVKSLEREIGHRYKGKTRTIPERVMHICDNGNGYKVVYLTKDKARRVKYIHRLVAESFINKPIGKEYVNHKDCKPSNNRVDNLEWCTQEENIQHSAEHMRKPRKNYKLGSTGEKYITFRKDKKVYRVTIKKKEYGAFKSLTEAIRRRDEILNETI